MRILNTLSKMTDMGSGGAGFVIHDVEIVVPSFIHSEYIHSAPARGQTLYSTKQGRCSPCLMMHKVY